MASSRTAPHLSIFISTSRITRFAAPLLVSRRTDMRARGVAAWRSRMALNIQLAAEEGRKKKEGGELGGRQKVASQNIGGRALPLPHSTAPPCMPSTLVCGATPLQLSLDSHWAGITHLCNMVTTVLWHVWHCLVTPHLPLGQNYPVAICCSSVTCSGLSMCLSSW